MLRPVFINLDSAAARRSEIEASFLRHAPPGLRLERFSAVTVDDVARLGVQGSIRATEMACFLSHRQVVMDHPPDDPRPLLVLEDDVEFGPALFRLVGNLLAATGFDWDLLYLDVGVVNIDKMIQLIKMRPALARAKRVAVLDLKEIPFSASAAYIVRPASLGKLRAVLSAPERLDEAHDLYLRRIVREGVLKAGCTFPFLTTLSHRADVSSNQLSASARSDLVWNTYRRLMWMDRDLSACAPLLERIRQECCDAEALLLSPILRALASNRPTPGPPA